MKCFKHDKWVTADINDLDEGDIFAHQGETYIAKSKAYIENGKPNILADIIDTSTITVHLSNEREYITMVMDYVCSPAHEFDDGTLLICDFSDANTEIYSPRLPVSELNDFCKKHIKHYEAFFTKHEKSLEAGERVPFLKFW